MTDRQQALAAALGSVRLEGAEPSLEIRALGERSARGEITTDELRAAGGRPPASPSTRRRPPAA